MIIYIPHGAGPLTLLNDSMHFELIDVLKNIGQKIPKPDAIIVISAHWEEEGAYITSGKQLSLIYDFSGFPKESYQLAYPVSGSPILAQRLFEVFSKNKMNTRLDYTRGIDHGVYVPLMLMYPHANVPCVQVSLQRTLDPKIHIQMGNALRELQFQNVLIIGSGFSFHHMRYFFDNDSMANSKNDQFQDWLIKTCTEKKSIAERLLLSWEQAPNAQFCHPRSEHLMPLMVCQGASKNPGRLIFDGNVSNKRTVGFIWD